MATCKECLHAVVCGKLIWNEKDGAIICGDFKARSEYVKQQVHAHWIIDEGGKWAECSNPKCREASKISEMEHKAFCPACGAIMDEEVIKL